MSLDNYIINLASVGGTIFCLPFFLGGLVGTLLSVVLIVDGAGISVTIKLLNTLAFMINGKLMSFPKKK